MKKHLWAILFSVCLTAYTVFISLDTFVIPSAYQTETTEMNLSLFEGQTNASDDSASDTGSAKQNNGDSGEETNRSRRERSTQGTQDTQGTRNTQKAQKTQETKNKQETQDTQETQNSLEIQDTQEEFDSWNAQELAGYQDQNIDISLTEYTVRDTAVYVADVTLSSAQYLKTAFAKDTYGKNVTAKTSAIASENSAILAINGDYYGAQEKGYVIRNGIVYRDKAAGADVLCIYADGSMKIVNPADVTAQELLDEDVWQAFSFGPALVENSEIAVSQNAEVGKAMASNPRTAIGIIDELHYLFVVSDGRTSESEGLSLYELAEFMKQLGVTVAYNLDGGGSTNLYVDGTMVASGRNVKNAICFVAE